MSDLTKIEDCRNNWGDDFHLMQEKAGDKASIAYCNGQIDFSRLKEIAIDNLTQGNDERKRTHQNS